MNNGITTHSPSYYVLRINGRVNSAYRRYEDAVRAGLQLKYQSPHDDIKVCEITSSGSRTMIGYIVLLATSFAIASILLGSRAFAQTTTPQEPTGNLVTIVTGNKFQQVVPATGTKRRSLTIKNSNTNDESCWVFIGGGRASKDNSIVLDPGSSYLRYSPFVPSDAIQATCASSSDTLDVEYQ